MTTAYFLRDEIITWIYGHPDVAMVYLTVLGLAFPVLGVILGWLLHGIKFNANKRSEAKTSYYPAIHNAIKTMEKELEKNDRLYISEPYNPIYDKGNIFTLTYLRSRRKVMCGSYHEINNEELQRYKRKALEINGLLKNTSTNIHPKICQKKRWNSSKETIIEFCDFLIGLEDEYVGESIKEIGETDKVPIHITKCKELKEAFKYVYEST